MKFSTRCTENTVMNTRHKKPKPQNLCLINQILLLISSVFVPNGMSLLIIMYFEYIHGVAEYRFV